MLKLALILAFTALVAGNGMQHAQALPPLAGPDDSCLDGIGDRLTKFEEALTEAATVKQDEPQSAIYKQISLPNFGAGNFGEILNQFVAQITNLGGNLGQITNIISFLPTNIFPQLGALLPQLGGGGSAGGGAGGGGILIESDEATRTPDGRSANKAEAVLAGLMQYMTGVYQSIDEANKKLIKILEDFANSSRQ